MRLDGSARLLRAAPSLQRAAVRLLCSVPLLAAPRAATDCWRPTLDDVERISWGKAAKQRGTGSRGVPHRLNSEERVAFDLARQKGYVELLGSGWRAERADAPLVNLYRNWCDARAVPAVYVFKSREATDLVELDLSPLRTPADFADAAAYALAAVDGAAADGTVMALEATAERLDDATLADAYGAEPIYRLPRYTVEWHRPRSEAKALAKALAAALGAAPPADAAAKGRKKVRGAPAIKPGKSRRHGGYGIG